MDVPTHPLVTEFEVDELAPVDPPAAIAPIDYDAQYTLVWRALRFVIEREEFSARGLRAAEAVIEANAAHYTAWEYRRRVTATTGQYAEETRFAERHLQENPKNYQLWHHHRCLTAVTGDFVAALAVCAQALEDDHKNYHAWAYRQWTVERFDLFQDEWAFVMSHIERDVRNNSAWSHRYFVYTHTHERDRGEEEVSAVLSSAMLAPHNESPWNYLRALSKYSGVQLLKLSSDLGKQLSQLVFETVNVPAACLLIDLLLETATDDNLTAAVKVARLMEERDHVRKAFWRMRLEQLRS